MKLHELAGRPGARKTRKRIVDFGLHQQTLRIGNVNQRCEACLIARTFLSFSCPSCVEFYGSVLGNMSRTIE